MTEEIEDRHDTRFSQEQKATRRQTDEPSARSGPVTIVGAFMRRDFRTVLLTPTYVVLGALVFMIVLTIALVGGSFEAGYAGVMLDLLVPLQLVVPLIAFALGYTSVIGDSRRGELDVLKTYPVNGWHVIAGSFLARGIGLAIAVAIPLILIAFAVAVTEPVRIPMYASHTGGDSVIYFARFLILTVGFGLVMLAIAVAISALLSTTRGVVATSAIALIVLIIGLDLGIAFGFSIGVVGEMDLIRTVAYSPLSAYRGLALETAIQVTPGTGPETADPFWSLVGLLGWGVGALMIGTVAVRGWRL